MLEDLYDASTGMFVTVGMFGDVLYRDVQVTNLRFVSQGCQNLSCLERLELSTLKSVV